MTRFLCLLVMVCSIGAQANADLIIKNRTDNPIKVCLITTFGGKHIYSNGFHALQPGASRAFKHGTDKSKNFWVVARDIKTGKSFTLTRGYDVKEAFLRPEKVMVTKKHHSYHFTSEYVAGRMANRSWKAFANRRETGNTIEVPAIRITPRNNKQNMDVLLYGYTQIGLRDH